MTHGQIQCITDNVDAGRSVTYTYDPLARLSTAVTTGSTNYPQWGLSWTYDQYGNRTAQSISAGCVAPQTCPTNAVTIDATTNRITGTPYSYDANGNMTNDGLNALVYDAENRLVTSSGSTYTYDGNNLRVKKVSGSTTTVYIFSGSKVIAEYSNGALSKEYIYSGSALLATVAGTTTTYHHPDHLSVRASTDSSGNLAGQQGHYPYGESWYSVNTTTKWQFTSYERDSESGSDYAMARYAVNRLGRFSTPDPIAGSISDPQSLNRYAYVTNDPINGRDPLGLFMCVDCDEDGGGGLDDRFFLEWTLCAFAGICRDDGGGPPDIDGGGGAAQGRSSPQRSPSKDCLKALADAGQTFDAVNRALAASGSILQAAADNEIDPNILAAIGVRESGFRDINERGGGGRGVFQVDLRSFPNADSFAHDIDRAADFAASLIQQRTDVYQRRGFSDALSIAGAIRDYNHGPRGTIDLLQSGDMRGLDRGTARGNYVTNVLAIAKNCFHF